jgi:hypothetical protein
MSSPGRRRPPGPAARLGLGLLAVAVLAADPAPPAAPRRPVAFDTHIFRWLLQRHKAEPVTDFARLAEDPAHSALIVLGWPGPLASFEGLESFVLRGGALLLAGDHQVAGEDLRARLRRLAGVTLTGELVRCPEGLGYRGKGDCPFVVPAPSAGPRAPDNPFAGCRVATNIPTDLRPIGPDGGWAPAAFPGRVAPLAVFAPGSYEAEAGERADPRTLLFAVGGDVGRGRVLVLADHSIFINEMMMPAVVEEGVAAPDQDNFEFARACVEWLQGEGGARKRVMLLDDGYAHPTFEVPLKQVKLPPSAVLDQADRQLAAMDGRLADLEDRDGLDGPLVRWLTRGEPGQWRRLGPVAALLLTGAGLVYGGYRLAAAGRVRADPLLPGFGRLLDRQRPAPLAEQRQRAQAEAGNLYDTARALVEQRLARWGGDPASPGGPRCEVHGTWWQRRAARRRLRRLWRLAEGRAPVRVTPGRWRSVLADLERLGADVARGVVQFR